MDDFEKLKFSGRSCNFDWINGFSTENVSKPDYQSMLVSNEKEIAAATDKYMRLYNLAVEDFKQKTSLTTLDMAILLLAPLCKFRAGLLLELLKR